jgi:hypothetical protein
MKQMGCHPEASAMDLNGLAVFSTMAKAAGFNKRAGLLNTVQSNPTSVSLNTSWVSSMRAPQSGGEFNAGGLHPASATTMRRMAAFSPIWAACKTTSSLGLLR